MKVVAVDTVGGTLDELKREIEIQRSLDHPNIAKIFEYFEDAEREEIHIVMVRPQPSIPGLEKMMSLCNFVTV